MKFEHPSKDIKSTKGNQLSDKTICVGVTGSVAAVNIINLCRELMRYGADVQVIMTEAATKLIHPNLLHWATGNEVIVELTGATEHIMLAGERPGKLGKADLILIAPATANTISKIACGIDDTPVTTLATTAFGSGTPIIIVPAMHESMYRHPIVLENIEKLRKLNVEVIMPRIIENKAKIAQTEDIINHIIDIFMHQNKKDCEGLNFLITAGPGREFIDRIRFISNPSSGKMGMELANELISRGGRVTVIFGKGGTAKPAIGANIIYVDSTEEFLSSIKKELSNESFNVFISAAAIPDYTPIQMIPDKIPSRENELIINLKPTPKIIENVRSLKNDIFIVAFKAETNLNRAQLIEKAYNRLINSKVNMIIANDVFNNSETGFQKDFNEVYIIQDDLGTKKVKHLKKASKRMISAHIIDEIIRKIRPLRTY